jgi:FkbM family methyltransferase
MSNLNVELLKLFYDIQIELKPEVSVEIGAFEASFSNYMQYTYNTEAYAFEANPYVYDNFFQTNQKINYINMAISDQEGMIPFKMQTVHKPSGQRLTKIRGNNSIMDRDDDNIDYESIYVPTDTLDNVMNLIPGNISMFIDVEGATQQVLEHGIQTLDRTSSIFIEVEEKAFWKNQWLQQDVNNFLSGRGFIKIARDREYEHQYNEVYIKEDLINRNILEKVLEWNVRHWA